MEVLLLDCRFRALRVAEGVQTVLWTRRLSGDGEVTVTLGGEHADCPEEAAYLYRTDTGEGAVLTEWSRTEEGVTCLKGREWGYLLALRRLKTSMAGGMRTDLAILEAIKEACTGEEGIAGLTVSDTLCGEAGVFAGADAGVDLCSLAAAHLHREGMRTALRAEGEGLVLSLVPMRDLRTEGRLCDSLADRASACLCGKRSRLPMGRALVRGVDASGEEMTVTVEGDAVSSGLFAECLTDGREIKRSWRDEEGVLHQRSEEEYVALLTLLGEQALEASCDRMTVTLGPDWGGGYGVDYVVGDRLLLTDPLGGSAEGQIVEMQQTLTPKEKTVRVTLLVRDRTDQ